MDALNLEPLSEDHFVIMVHLLRLNSARNDGILLTGKIV